ncbi:phage tail protein [Paraburkholderia pallida]|uniref:Uncharacterized protein n=1 Tax=Paraburkholderia pallida TaxID=2547399 RepID=A0A4P7CQR3_9BURK|nr:phage tail protein [Paraburkholderia pallida]QBQ98165.1 hypothetical protein E1956_13935 [Paraburkholderia pallida]
MAGGGTIRNSEVPEVALRLQGSSYGNPIPVIHGRTRVRPNLIWYGDFKAIAHTSSESAGGKGGGPDVENTTYTYTVAVAMALGAGVVSGIGRVWADKTVTTPAKVGLTLFSGADDQQPWDYLVTKHPTEALHYPGIAYLAAGAYDLGSSASLPQHTFEVQGRGRYSEIIPDATPLTILSDWLTEPSFGAGFPADRIGDMKAFDDYTVAMGLFMSPALTEANATIDLLAQMAVLTGCDWLDSDGKIHLIPLTTMPVSGNGRTFEPDLTPVYYLTDDDLLDDGDGEPIRVKRKLGTDACNQQALEFNDRDNDYNTNCITAEDRTNIDAYGERPADRVPAPWICKASIAENAAYLKMGRTLYGRNEYTFRLPPRFVLIEPGDVVTLNDAHLGMVDEPVRVTQIDNDPDGTLSVTAEEIIWGYGAPVAFGTQAALGYRVNFGQKADGVNDPVIFNAPLSLTNEVPEVWIAAAGNASNWSGCDVWVSLDGVTYARVGSITSPARYGAITDAIGEDADRFDVDMTMSGGVLQGGDAQMNATLSWCGGELVSFTRATLTQDSKYTLEGVLRGRVRTARAMHPVMTRFVRIDSSIFRYQVPEWFIGSAVYLKFPSRNMTGGGTQSLDEVDPYLHEIRVANTLPGGMLGLRLLDGFVGDRFRVGWAAQPASGFEIQLTSGNGLVRAPTTVLNEWTYTTVDAYADGGPKRQYLVTVTAINGVGPGVPSTLAVSKPAPPAPSNVHVAAGRLVWGDVEMPDRGGYFAWLGDSAAFDPRRGEGLQIYVGPDTSVNLSGLTAGLRYYARVACFDQWSNVVADLNLSAAVSFIG